jgi:hypothetical protein
MSTGFGNMGQVLKMAQKMQQDLARAQEEVGQRTIDATAGGGAVQVTVSGRKEIQAIRIAPEVLRPEEAEILQDMLIAALNQALRQADELMSQAVSKLTGGLKLPGLF